MALQAKLQMSFDGICLYKKADKRFHSINNYINMMALNLLTLQSQVKLSFKSERFT
jgi:hypothetical protein